MSNNFSGNEAITTLVLANVSIAFTVLSEYSPNNSRPYLILVATALGLIALYPLFLLLQKPRRYKISKESEGENTSYHIKYKGYLWWYPAKNLNGKPVTFKSMDEVLVFVRENLVTALINQKIKRKQSKREVEVIFDSKDLIHKSTKIEHKAQTKQQTVNPEDSKQEKDPPKENSQHPKVKPDNQETLNFLQKKAQKAEDDSANESFKQKTEQDERENLDETVEQPDQPQPKPTNQESNETDISKRLFDVCYEHNKRANHQPKNKTSETKNPIGSDKKKDIVNENEIVDDEKNENQSAWSERVSNLGLVNANPAEMVTHNLSKLNEQRQRAQQINNPPTNRSHPSSEEKYLREQYQKAIHGLPQSDQHRQSTKLPVENQTTTTNSNETDEAEQPASSGGNKIVKKIVDTITSKKTEQNSFDNPNEPKKPGFPIGSENPKEEPNKQILTNLSTEINDDKDILPL